MKVLVAVLAGTWLATAASAAAPATSLQQNLQDDLQKYLTARGAAEHLSALSLSVSLPGQANLNATAGTTQFAGGTAVKPGNLFQIGSNTKAFTAVTLLQLEAEGKLSIEDPLGKFLPQYPLWHDVTIKRLLDMTSGIPTYDNDQAMQRAYAASPHKDFTPQALIAYVYPTTEGAPGPTTGWSYSNTNYVLAELIIEKVSGHTYAAEVRQRFFTNPALHLGDSYYSAHEYPANVLKRMVAGYFYSNTPDNLGLAPLYGTDVKGLTLSWARGAGGIVATPEDVTHWTRALYQGALLKPAQQRELTSLVSLKTGEPIASVDAEHPRGFGLGVTQMLMPPMGKFWFYQGETLGNRVIYVWLPESNLVFALGMNSAPNEAENHAPELLKAIYQSLHAAGKV